MDGRRRRGFVNNARLNFMSRTAEDADGRTVLLEEGGTSGGWKRRWRITAATDWLKSVFNLANTSVGAGTLSFLFLPIHRSLAGEWFVGNCGPHVILFEPARKLAQWKRLPTTWRLRKLPMVTGAPSSCKRLCLCWRLGPDVYWSLLADYLANFWWAWCCKTLWTNMPIRKSKLGPHAKDICRQPS